MKRNTKLRLQTFAPCICLCLLFGLLFAGCAGWNQINESGAQPNAGTDPPEVPEEFTTIPVKMRPQEQVEFPVGGLATSSVSPGFVLPSALQSMLPPSKAVSFDVFDLNKLGSAFDPALPLNKVESAGGVAKFDPTWDPGNQTLGDVAYCTYSFPLLDFGISTQEQTLGMDWDPVQSPESFFDVFVGFGNIAEDAWDWYQGADDGVLTVDSFLPYENLAGDVLIVIALLNTKQCFLKSLTVGELEFRGLGELYLEPLTQIQLMPNFWQLLNPDFSVDLSPDCSPVNDQGGMGSCTAFAVGDSAFNYELGQIYDVFGWDFTDPFNLVSPRFIYLQTGVDLGGTCPTGFRNTWEIAQWEIDNGTATEQNAPYGSLSSSLFDCTADDWSAAALADAELLKFDTKTFIATWDAPTERYHLTDDDINDVRTVLREQRRVVPFRTQIDWQFSNPDYANGETWTYDGNNRGGHAMCIVGYDDTIGATGAFKVRNSWGVNWGDNGYCWISYESFKDTDAGAYCFYITAHCDPDIVARFCDDAPLIFPPCGMDLPFFYPERIVFEWEPVLGATRYLIFRDRRIEPIGSISAPIPPKLPEFVDMEVQDNLAHVYWVQATDGNYISDFSSPVVGWLEGAMP